MKFTAFNNDINTTNNKYTNSIDFMTTANVINETELYEQINDEEHDWIKGSNVLGNEEWQCYVEAEDPRNIITDNISYFNATYEYKMHALSNQSDYYDGYYAAFSNYCFESLGWRYNTVIQFQKIKKSIYYYTVHSNINNIIISLLELHKRTFANMYNELGLRDSGEGKRESLNEAEIQSSDQILLPLVDDMLQERKLACKLINEMFGLSVSVRLDSSWEDLEKEIEEEHELVEAEIEEKEQTEEDSSLEDYDESNTDEEQTDEEDSEE